jgi:hypothetical protein
MTYRDPTNPSSVFARRTKTIAKSGIQMEGPKNFNDKIEASFVAKLKHYNQKCSRFFLLYFFQIVPI